MIKYTGIEGYRNLGELCFLSHIYQFIEEKKDTPIVILLNAYETNKVFKGYLLVKTKTYSSVPLTDSEKEELEKVIGTVFEVDFTEFTKGTILEEDYSDFNQVAISGV